MVMYVLFCRKVSPNEIQFSPQSLGLMLILACPTPVDSEDTWSQNKIASIFNIKIHGVQFWLH